MKTLSKAVAIASLLSAGVMSANMANAEVSASAGIATTYLYRGVSLSNGEAAVSGSLDYGHDSGAYAGAWSGSGDKEGGTETDVYAGYYAEVGDISIDTSYLSAMYPGKDDVNDWAEVTLAVGFDAFSLTMSKNTDSEENGDYLSAELGMGAGDFTFTVGNMSGVETKTYGSDYTYANIDYSFNDSISFTYSQIVDQTQTAAAIADEWDELDEGGVFVVSYSMPIE